MGEPNNGWRAQNKVFRGVGQPRCRPANEQLRSFLAQTRLQLAAPAAVYKVDGRDNAPDTEQTYTCLAPRAARREKRLYNGFGEFRIHFRLNRPRERGAIDGIVRFRLHQPGG